MRFVLLLIFCGLTSAINAQTYPDYVSTTVNDFADVLSTEDARALDQRLQALRDEQGVEMVVVTLSSQARYAPQLTMEQFAIGLFNDWGIGDSTRNDGVLVLVLVEDRAMRVELGLGYGRVWDATTEQIIATEFLPWFREGDYARGIVLGSQELIS